MVLLCKRVYTVVLIVLVFFLGAMALRPNAGHGLLILEVSRSHNDARHLIGLLWTSDQLVVVLVFVIIMGLLWRLIAYVIKNKVC